MPHVGSEFSRQFADFAGPCEGAGFLCQFGDLASPHGIRQQDIIGTLM